MNSEPLDLSKNNFISNFPLSQPGAGSMQLNPVSISALSPITMAIILAVLAIMVVDK